VTNQPQPKPYWKDALRQAQLEIEAPESAEATELSPAHNRKWANAYRQARADMEDPTAIVWLPDEIADFIRQAHQEPAPSKSYSHRYRLTVLLLTILLLTPVAISYLLAYRRIIMTHTR